MKKLILLFSAILFNLFCANSQSITLDPNNNSLKIKSNANTYGNMSTNSITGADLYFRLSEPLNGDGSNGTIIGTMATYPTSLNLYSYPNKDLFLGSGGNFTRLNIKANGKIGIGTISPNGELQFNSTSGINRRIVLYEEFNNDHQFYGFGINDGILRYQVTGGASHVFYAATSGNASNEIGRFNANGSFSAGGANFANGTFNIALGYDNNTTGGSTIALGVSNNSSNGVTLGSNNSVNSFYSTAIGQAISITAGGDKAVAIGNRINVSSTGDGSITFTDDSNTGIFNATIANRFSARYANGYYLYSNSASNLGAFLPAGGNGWSVISDSTKKENFSNLNGEDLLSKLPKIKSTTWNYKGQNPSEFRHYGPMAQDFHNAFGKDSFGSIGNDSTISTTDMAGVSFSLIQALEKRTTILIKENETLKEQISKLKFLNEKIEKLEEKILNAENIKTELAK